MCLDTFSYLLGKKSGGGGEDLSEYFVNGDYSINASGCIKKLPFDVDFTGVTIASNFFYGWANLETITIRNGTSLTNVYGMFKECQSLKFIDVRDIVFSAITTGANRNGMLSQVPNDCLIIVKDDTEKQWFATYYQSWTNVKTVAEYEAQQ